MPGNHVNNDGDEDDDLGIELLEEVLIDGGTCCNPTGIEEHHHSQMIIK